MEVNCSVWDEYSAEAVDGTIVCQTAFLLYATPFIMFGVTLFFAIFLLIIGAHIMSDLLTLTGLARDFTSWVNEAGLSRWQFLCIVLLGYIILGMFMDPLLIMILTVPLLVPSLTGLDVSLLWFGVFVVLTAELAILTPPVGILSFIVHGITRSREVNQGQEISLQDIFVAVLWFMPIAILFALILIAFPALATWLPSQM